MAILSNINDKFAVDSTGAIQFNGQAGTSGYVLKSNGNAAPTWVDASTVIGGPYLPLSGGTLTGATATASGISFTVGGDLTVGDATATNQGLRIESGNGTGDYGAVRFKHGGANRNTIHAFSQYWQSGTIYTAATDSLNLDGHAGVTIGPWNNIDVAFVEGGASYFKNNVGIGTASPSEKLTLQLNTQNQAFSGKNGTDYLWFLRNEAGAGARQSGRFQLMDTDVTTVNIESASNRNTYFNAGNVGIGTTSPTNGKLQVDTASGNNLTLRKGIGYGAIALGGVTNNEAVCLIEGNPASSGFRVYNGTGTLASPTWTAGMDFYDGGRLHPYGGVFLGSSNNSNLLTHYEKGIWTPVIAHHDGSGVIPSTTNQAAWVRVGSLVTLSAYITGINPNGNAGGSGLYYGFKGFPYPPSVLSTWNMVYVSSAITSYGGYMSSASMYFNIINANGTNGAGHANGAVVNSWGSNWACIISATYIIA